MGDNLNGIFANMIQGMGFIGCAPNRVYNMAPPDGGGVEATAEGTDLSLHSAAAPLTALTIYGKSEQETTTGKNIMPPERGASIDADIPANTDIWIVTDGTPSNGGNVFCYDADENIHYAVIDSGDVERKYAFSVAIVKIQNMLAEGVATAFYVGEKLPYEPYTGGTPSPSPNYPQEIKSVGDSGAINVTLSDGGSQSQTLPVQTQNGLPGIPVSSGGNYTDANGQQWICDEVDFERGVYVQRVKEISDIAWRLHTGYTVDGSELFFTTNITDGLQSGDYQNSAYCSKLIRDNNVLNLNMSGFYQSYGSAYARIKDIGDIDSFLELMQGAVILYQLETPVETTLSPSDIAAYSALRTYSPTTVVSNDAGAWMRVGYKATPQPMTMLARKR